MSYETILYDVSDRIATITLNRPEVLNAVSKQMQRELYEAFTSAEKDEDVGSFQRMVARSEIGSEVSIGLLRDGEAIKLAVRVGAKPKVVPDEQETDFGFTVQEVTDALYRSHRLTQREVLLRAHEGAAVREVAVELPLEDLRALERDPKTGQIVRHASPPERGHGSAPR